MFINKVSVPLNEYNFEILVDIADREQYGIYEIK